MWIAILLITICLVLVITMVKLIIFREQLALELQRRRHN